MKNLNKSIEKLSRIYDLEDRTELYKKPFYCPFAFRYVYGEESGMWKLCSEAEDTKYTNKDYSIKKWFNSDYVNKIRNEMLKDDPDLDLLSTSCRRCVQSEREVGNSTRTMLVAQDDNFSPEIKNANLFKLTGKYHFVDRPLIIQMRMFKNNSTCNLGCYMCFPKFSTIRRNDLNKIEVKLVEDFDNKKHWHEGESSVKDVFDTIDYINTIEIIGGEPLYIKECFDFVEKLVAEKDCSEIKLSIFTNLSVISNNGRNFLNYAKHFRQIEFKISLDGVGKYNEYIRKRSVWDDLQNNIIEIQKHPNCTCFVWTTVSMLSILRFDEVEKWCKEQGIRHEHNILRDPEKLAIKNLPKPLKEELISRFSHLPDIVDNLKLESNDKAFQDAMQYIIALDKQYKSNVFDVYPELESFTLAL